jgi:hypothetical protein
MSLVFIAQINKAKRKALEVTFREHCLGARTGLIFDDISKLVNSRGGDLVKKLWKRSKNLGKKSGTRP